MRCWMGSPIAGRIRCPTHLCGRMFYCMLLHFPDLSSSPGDRFWMGWWGYAKRQGFAQDASKTTQDASKIAQNCLKKAQEARSIDIPVAFFYSVLDCVSFRRPKRVQESSNVAACQPKRLTKGAPGRPKRAPRLPKKPSRLPKRPSRRP